MKLSIAMMVKNESKHLDECLASLDSIRKNISSELIIVDTGSTDNTVEIAKKYTDKVYFHKWNNNFSEMRNITIDYCKGEWILIIDGDEVVEEIGNLIEFFNSDKYKKYNSAACIVKNITSEKRIEDFSVLNSLRFFKNDGIFHYDGIVHNKPVYQNPVFNLSTSFLHYGYVSDDKNLMERKFKRTATLLINELKKNPNNIYYLYQLSTSYTMHHDYDEAVEPMEKAYRLMQGNSELKKTYVYLYSQMALVYMKLNRKKDIEEICFEGISIKKDFLDLYYFLAFAQLNMEKYEEAFNNFKTFLRLLCEIERKRNYPSFEYYTLGLKDDVYSKISYSLYMRRNYDCAMDYIEKMEEKSLTESSIKILIKSCITLKKYKKIYSFFNEKLKEDTKKRKYIKILIDEINRVNEDIQKKIIKEFINNIEFNVLFKSKQCILEGNFKLNNELYNEICKIKFNNVDANYGEVIYYLLKCNKNLKDILTVRESKIYEMLQYMSNQYIDLNKVIYEYLKKNNDKSLSNIRINKILSKVVLLLDDLDKKEYKYVMDKYIEYGIKCLKEIYKENILEKEKIELLKDDEDAFLLYIYKANCVKEMHSKEYVNYLRKALRENEFYKKVIEIMLEDFQEYEDNKENDITPEQNEFEIYKAQVKNTIKVLIESGKLSEAQVLINEYESIVKDDVEIVLLKSEIILNKVNKKSNINN